MAPHLIKNKRLLLRYVSYDANQASLYYAKVLFARFDRKTIKKHPFNYKVVNFDYKNGRYCDLLWKKAYCDIIIRVVRTKNNKCYVYSRNILTDIYWFFFILISNFVKK